MKSRKTRALMRRRGEGSIIELACACQVPPLMLAVLDDQSALIGET